MPGRAEAGALRVAGRVGNRLRIDEVGWRRPGSLSRPRARDESASSCRLLAIAARWPLYWRVAYMLEHVATGPHCHPTRHAPKAHIKSPPSPPRFQWRGFMIICRFAAVAGGASRAGSTMRKPRALLRLNFDFERHRKFSRRGAKLPVPRFKRRNA